MEKKNRLLPNVHNLVTWNHGQNYLFNGCMQYLMECLNESKEYDYWFFSGVTGDSFTQVYRRDFTKFTCCLSQDTFDYDLAKKAFDACGYDFQYIDEPGLRANQPVYVKRIVEYIDKGIPVISRGCEGTGEFSAICGYENGGDTFLFLKGDDTTPTPYRNDLICHIGLPMGLVFVGDKKTTPPLANVYRTAIENIPSLITMSPKDGLTFGKQAFDDWADSFLDGRFADIPDEDINVWKVHGTYLCISGTNGCSRGFLAKALEFCPDLDIIVKLQPIYERMQELWETLLNMEGGFNILPSTIKSRDAMNPICDQIRKFSRCCDEILEVFA